MKFKYGTRRKAIEYEKDIAEFWKQNKIFEKSVENRPAENSYVFYDGPPFITGSPHYGTLLSSVVKDCVPRYQTMLGKRVERRWGWDCHGLPAENFVEQKLGITDRRDIGTKITLEEYITKARESMVANSEIWESYVDRIGRWVDFKGAYKTMDKDFMESVWWAFKTLYDKGLIYEGKKVLMYDTKFATPVSKAEVTMDNDAYQTVTDPAVFVKFKLADSNEYLLAWTTTPWTLPGNIALAVNPELKYVEVEVNGEKIILSEKQAKTVLTDEKHQPLEYQIIKKIPGKELVGLRYKTLFPELISHIDSNNIHTVYPADFVGEEEGTGIVHIAPAYGEDDSILAEKYNLPMIDVLDEEGVYVDGPYKGLEIWENNKFIAKDLFEKGNVWKIEYIQHEYPFNPRSGQRIMYRAFPSWFFDIQGQKPLMLDQNENIYWFPTHIKHGRFEKNIEQAPDWNISRDRFWATAMPVWKGDKGTVKVIGSYAELKELSGVELEDYHRPWVDEIEFDIDGEHFKRIEKVLDGWFESGSMPFAQMHYPFENKELFEANYPADFISEYVAQVRAWFYYVHVINTALFGENAFKNCIVTGTIAGEDGRKMSKSLGNYTDPAELMDKYSADSLRFLLLSCPLLSGEDFILKEKEVSDIARKLSMIWNVYDFFTMYSEVDGWEYDLPVIASDSEAIQSNDSLDRHVTDVPRDDAAENILDIWIVSRVHQLRDEVTKYLDEYNIPDAMAPILPFVDDLSNWYVRRSRRRFWKSEDDNDKNDAYKTLHYVLIYLAQIMAPFTPFLAEELYQKLIPSPLSTKDGEGQAGYHSVHLLDWPKLGEINQIVLDDMTRAREIIEQGLAQRMNTQDEFGQIKVRQPLSKLEYFGEKLDEYYEQIIAEEVNVKSVVASEAKQSSLDRHVTEVPRDDTASVTLDKKITPELKREGQAREIIRIIQNARKEAGLNVDDRIIVNITTDSRELNLTIDEYRETIATEILAIKLTCHSGLDPESRKNMDSPIQAPVSDETSVRLRKSANDDGWFKKTAKIDDTEISITLSKTGA